MKSNFLTRDTKDYRGRKKDVFTRFANRVAHITGTAHVFTVALAVIMVWGITGPLFHFSDTWQLVINTGTTIITFLMVFLIQNTQNRDSAALHLKIDALLVATPKAKNILVELEDLSQEELDVLKAKFTEMADKAGDVLAPALIEEFILDSERTP